MSHCHHGNEAADCRQCLAEALQIERFSADSFADAVHRYGEFISVDPDGDGDKQAIYVTDKGKVNPKSKESGDWKGFDPSKDDTKPGQWSKPGGNGQQPSSSGKPPQSPPSDDDEESASLGAKINRAAGLLSVWGHGIDVDADGNYVVTSPDGTQSTVDAQGLIDMVTAIQGGKEEPGGLTGIEPRQSPVTAASILMGKDAPSEAAAIGAGPRLPGESDAEMMARKVAAADVARPGSQNIEVSPEEQAQREQEEQSHQKMLREARAMNPTTAAEDFPQGTGVEIKGEQETPRQPGKGPVQTSQQERPVSEPISNEELHPMLGALDVANGSPEQLQELAGYLGLDPSYPWTAEEINAEMSEGSPMLAVLQEILSAAGITQYQADAWIRDIYAAQLGLWDEEAHPRDDAGKFAKKEESDKLTSVQNAKLNQYRDSKRRSSYEFYTIPNERGLMLLAKYKLDTGQSVFDRITPDGSVEHGGNWPTGGDGSGSQMDRALEKRKRKLFGKGNEPTKLEAEKVFDDEPEEKPKPEPKKRMTASEQLARAAELGREHAQAGKKYAMPAEVLQMLEGREIGETPEGEASSQDIMEAFSKAWHSANVAKGTTKEPQAITEEEYLSQKGASRQDIGDAALHRGINTQSKAARKRNIENQAAKDAALLEKRAKLRAEYKSKIESGEIREKTGLEKRLKTAQGHPDNESTQAARRLLTKRGIDWKTGEKLKDSPGITPATKEKETAEAGEQQGLFGGGYRKEKKKTGKFHTKKGTQKKLIDDVDWDPGHQSLFGATFAEQLEHYTREAHYAALNAEAETVNAIIGQMFDDDDEIEQYPDDMDIWQYDAGSGKFITVDPDGDGQGQVIHVSDKGKVNAKAKDGGGQWKGYKPQKMIPRKKPDKDSPGQMGLEKDPFTKEYKRKPETQKRMSWKDAVRAAKDAREGKDQSRRRNVINKTAMDYLPYEDTPENREIVESFLKDAHDMVRDRQASIISALGALWASPQKRAGVIGQINRMGDTKTGPSDYAKIPGFDEAADAFPKYATELGMIPGIEPSSGETSNEDELFRHIKALKGKHPIIPGPRHPMVLDELQDMIKGRGGIDAIASDIKQAEESDTTPTAASEWGEAPEPSKPTPEQKAIEARAAADEAEKVADDFAKAMVGGAGFTKHTDAKMRRLNKEAEKLRNKAEKLESKLTPDDAVPFAALSFADAVEWYASKGPKAMAGQMGLFDDPFTGQMARSPKKQQRLDWDETKHPRGEAGSGKGGQFVKKGEGKASPYTEGGEQRFGPDGLPLGPGEEPEPKEKPKSEMTQAERDAANKEYWRKLGEQQEAARAADEAEQEPEPETEPQQPADEEPPKTEPSSPENDEKEPQLTDEGKKAQDERNNKAPPEDRPNPNGTPRQRAAFDMQELDADYEFARKSAVPNFGEDLKGSARHKVNAWRSLDEAEEDGTAEEMVTRNQLLKNEPHELGIHLDDNPIGVLTMNEAMRAFPAKPGYGQRSRTAEQKKKNRADYLEVYRKVKAEAERIAASDQDNPMAANDALAKFVKGEIDRLRKDDRYNDTANGLVNYLNRLGLHRRKTSLTRKVGEFMLAFEKTGDNIADIRDNLISATASALEGKTLSSLMPTKEGEKKKKFRPVDAFVGYVKREGGRDLGLDAAGSSKFLKDAGFRGGQFGNSMSDPEREHHAMRTAEAVADLADVMGMTPADMSLDGKLGLAFGARGRAGAAAHYEPGNKVINLTREHGAGALAHEWGHAFDHAMGGGEVHTSFGQSKGDATYLSQDGGVTYTSTKNPKTGKWERKVEDRTDEPLFKAMQGVRDAWNESGFHRRLVNAVGKMRKEGRLSGGKESVSSSGYWTSNHEMFARTFERHVAHTLKQDGRRNTYLAGFMGELWPTAEESAKMAPAFDALITAYRKEKTGSTERQTYTAAERRAFIEQYAAAPLPTFADAVAGIQRRAPDLTAVRKTA